MVIVWGYGAQNQDQSAYAALGGVWTYSITVPVVDLDAAPARRTWVLTDRRTTWDVDPRRTTWTMPERRTTWVIPNED